MSEGRNKILEETIKRLLRRGAIPNLRKIVNKTHAADLSIVFRNLSINNQRKLFDMIEDYEQRAVLLSELTQYTITDFIETMAVDELLEVFDHMPSDDVADLIADLPQDTADAVLEKMNSEESQEVEDLLSYGDDTAGGIMVPDFVALSEEISAKGAIESLQKDYPDVEMPFYLYVVDVHERLVGVVSLRQLVVVKPDTPLKEFMTTDIFSVQTDVDQEEVARIVAHYDILAVPVVDDNNRIVGIVTVDDVIDIFRQEATEDILKMAGVGEEFVETQSVVSSIRIRFPWLFASCLGGILAFFIIGYFEDSLKQVTYLAAFLPVIMGMGGNVGTQSSTIVVRGLATGRLLTSNLWKVVGKELCIGVILGTIYGALIGVAAEIRFGTDLNTTMLAISVGLAVFCSMSIAALMGSLVPMILGRINIDPAVATGPFVTTSVDIVSIYCYFSIATHLLNL